MVVILENIRSVHNVGSIFRTADSLGVKNIYLAGITPSPLDRFGKFRKDFAKTALGAETFLKWRRFEKTEDALETLRRKKFKILAVEQAAKSVPYYKYKMKKKDFAKIALLLGNEISGVSKEALRLSDKILEIPMLGKKESLNVAISFAIVGFGLKYAEN